MGQIGCTVPASFCIQIDGGAHMWDLRLKDFFRLLYVCAIPISPLHDDEADLTLVDQCYRNCIQSHCVPHQGVDLNAVLENFRPESKGQYEIIRRYPNIHLEHPDILRYRHDF